MIFYYLVQVHREELVETIEQYVLIKQETIHFLRYPSKSHQSERRYLDAKCEYRISSKRNQFTLKSECYIMIIYFRRLVRIVLW